MTDPHGDPRAVRTRAKLRRALLDACAQRPLAQISVAALVRRAGVGRATFYLHYADLEALAVDACADVVRDAVDALHAWRGTPDPASPPLHRPSKNPPRRTAGCPYCPNEERSTRA